MITPGLIHPFHCNIEGCEGYTMGILTPYKVNDIYTIANYIDSNIDKNGMDKIYDIYGDCIITHTAVIKKLNEALFDNKLVL